jgi:hypothetical protein
MDKRDYKGTVADPEIAEHGGIIRLPVLMKSAKSYFKGTERFPILTKTVRIPAVHSYSPETTSVVLDGMLLKANNLVKNIQNYKKEKTEQRLGYMQKSLYNYYNELFGRLAGKKGLLTKRFSVRTNNSMRAVIGPGHGISWDEVGIPQMMLEYADIEDGSYVLLFRQPVLGADSCPVLKVKAIPDNGGNGLTSSCIRIHKVYLDALDADFDGDTVSVVKIDKENNGFAIDALERQKATLCWPTESIISIATSKITDEDKVIDFENFKEQEAKIEKVTGLSIHPKDLFEPGGFLNKVKEVLPKKYNQKEFLLYAEGLTVKQFRKVAEKISTSTYATKTQVGKIGACTDRLNECYETLEQLDASSFIKKILTEASMDFKHENDYTKLRDGIRDVLSLINDAVPRENGRYIGKKEFTKRFSKYFKKLTPKKIGPAAELIYDYKRGVMMMFALNCKLFNLTKTPKDKSVIFSLYSTKDQKGIGSDIDLQRDKHFGEEL